MDNENLKPCPFCGNPAELHVSYPGFGRRREVTVRCTVCRANSGNWGRSDYAIKGWNIRTIDVPDTNVGKWLPENRTLDAFWVCSSCGFPSEAHAANILYKFCPNCGANMRSEQDG